MEAAGECFQSLGNFDAHGWDRTTFNKTRPPSAVILERVRGHRECISNRAEQGGAAGKALARRRVLKARALQHPGRSDGRHSTISRRYAAESSRGLSREFSELYLTRPKNVPLPKVEITCTRTGTARVTESEKVRWVLGRSRLG